MKNILRFISASAALFMLASSFVSCGETQNTDGNNDESQAVATAVETDAATEAVATEPAPNLEAKDFNGRTFRILCDKWSTYDPLDYTDITPEKLTGEVLNDAAYNRNLVMQTKYNCNVQMDMLAHNLGIGLVTKGVSSGDFEYDVFLMRSTNLATAVTKGYLTDFNSINNIDMSKPWWDSNSLDAITVNGKSYATISYVSTNYMKSVFAMVFNKDILTSNGLEDPYTLADQGKWTFAKVIEMSKVTARDNNGDGAMGSGDLFGINYTRDCFTGMLQACNLSFAEINADNEVVLTLNSEKNIERLTEICDMLFDGSHAADTLSGNIIKAQGTDLQFFTEGLATFSFTATHTLDTIKSMSINFGMVQYPKYAEDEEYRSPVAGQFLSLTTVPTAVKDTDDVGYFLEAYSYEGYKSLLPAFYNIIIQGRMVPDSNASVILDNIYSDISYDTGVLYNFGSLVSNVNGLAKAQNKNVASYFKTVLSPIEKAIKSFNNSVKE